MSEKSWKPTGYQSVSVYIVARGAAKTIDFLKAAFGAQETFRMDRSTGLVAHAELRIDDSVVMLTDGSPQSQPFPVWMHLYVPDADATYRRALEAGATSVQEPSKKEGDPDRRGA